MTVLKGKRVVVAGGTGLVGRPLVSSLAAVGADVVVLERRPSASPWPVGVQTRAWSRLDEALDGAHGVVNLAGAGITERRWTPTRKALLLDSRIQPTRALVDAVARLSHPPAVLVNASAVGYYGASGDAPLDEASPAGRGFLSELCQAWEREAERAQSLGVRVLRLRLGVVLARDGGALQGMADPLRRWVGTIPGSGRQGFSWIHRKDLITLILEGLAHPAYEGALNATAPHPLSMGDFMRLLARTLGRPLWPLPPVLSGAALRLFMGEVAQELLLEGAYVVPKRAMELGFHFRFARAEEALVDLLS